MIFIPKIKTKHCSSRYRRKHRRGKEKEENMTEFIITMLLYVAPYFITWRTRICITVHISDLQ
jgi:hypothetical protein